MTIDQLRSFCLRYIDAEREWLSDDAPVHLSEQVRYALDKLLAAIQEDDAKWAGRLHAYCVSVGAYRVSGLAEAAAKENHVERGRNVIWLYAAVCVLQAQRTHPDAPEVLKTLISLNTQVAA